jgi:hypothetical protein
MSGSDPTQLINANHGNLSAVLSSANSVWMPKGFSTSNIFAIDNLSNTTAISGTQVNFGGIDRFRLRKRGGRIHKLLLKIDISAGVVAAGNEAAFADDLGALIIANARLEYGSKTLQEYQGEPVKAYWRLMQHDVFREPYAALAWALMPPGVTGGYEATRQANTAAAFSVYVPLDWFWSTRFEDYAQTPESLASELELVIQYQALARLVYARVTATGLTPVASPFTTAPAITATTLYTQLIHTPVPEKNLHLSIFESPQGKIDHILDLEPQTNIAVAAAAGTYRVKLDNFRLDSQFIMFYMRSSLINTDWAIDRMQSDVTATILTGGGSVAALQTITSFRLLANGNTIVDSQTDVFNRAWLRKNYFPGSQIAEPIYFVPFGVQLRDAKNVHGFQNLANLGNIELELVVPVRSQASVLDVYNVCHNIIQSKEGDIIKALR